MHSIAIDFGATNSVVALAGERPHVVRDAHGSSCMPSAVGWDAERGCVVVGRAAKENADRFGTIGPFKQYLGTTERLHVGPHAWLPEEVLAEVIKALKQQVEAEIGAPVTDAVLTVPARFTEAARAAIVRAGVLAGLNVQRVLSEGAAAVMAFRPQAEGRILVYHLGGATLDVTIMDRRTADTLNVVATAGSAGGGSEFDRRLVDHLVELVARQHGVSLDPTRDQQAYQTLQEAAEKTKIALSSQPQHRVSIPALTTSDGKLVNLDAVIRVEEFNALIDELVQGTLAEVDRALQSAALDKSHIDQVLLVGGSTQVPLVRRALGEHFGKAPDCSVNPMTAVAEGAATRASPQLHENVQFTVYRPKSVRPERWHTLLAFAHLDERPPDAPPEEPDPLQEVKRQASQVLGTQLRDYQETRQDSLEAVPRTGELTFLPEMDGAQFNPPHASIRFVESVHKVEFRMRAAADRDGQTLRGRLSVFWGAILLAEVPLRIKVDRACEPSEPAEPLPLRRYRKIFASYSHRDAPVVEQFERLAETFGDRYLRDCRDLRAGERWDDRLLEMIEEADVFQLFWSSNSMRSPYCRREWEHALSLARESFIRPTYWEDPLPQAPEEGLPPSLLLDLHFTRLRGDGLAASAQEHLSLGIDTRPAERGLELTLPDDGTDVLAEEESSASEDSDDPISLAPADSGLSLEQPLELGGEELLEEGSSVRGTLVDDDEFLLTPAVELGEEELDEGGSQVISLDTEGNFDDLPASSSVAGDAAELEEEAMIPPPLAHSRPASASTTARATRTMAAAPPHPPAGRGVNWAAALVLIIFLAIVLGIVIAAVMMEKGNDVDKASGLGGASAVAVCFSTLLR